MLLSALPCRRGVIQHEKRLCNFSSSLTGRSVPLDIISSCVASLINQVLLIKPRDYKWGAAAPSDITDLEHIKEKKEKKKRGWFFFFNYRKIRATQTCESTEELEMRVMTAPELISACSLMGSTSDKKQPALSNASFPSSWQPKATSPLPVLSLLLLHFPILPDPAQQTSPVLGQLDGSCSLPADICLLRRTQTRPEPITVTLGRIYGLSPTAASWTQREPSHPLLTPPKTKWKVTKS